MVTGKWAAVVGGVEGREKRFGDIRGVAWRAVDAMRELVSPNLCCYLQRALSGL